MKYVKQIVFLPPRSNSGCAHCPHSTIEPLDKDRQRDSHIDRQVEHAREVFEFAINGSRSPFGTSLGRRLLSLHFELFDLSRRDFVQPLLPKESYYALRAVDIFSPSSLVARDHGRKVLVTKSRSNGAAAVCDKHGFAS
jgi:hypothetical protein